MAVSILGPGVSSDPVTPLSGSTSSLALITAGALVALLAIATLRRACRTPKRPQGSGVTGELAFGEPMS